MYGPRRRRRPLRLYALILSVFAIAIAAIGYFVYKSRTGNISNPNVEFNARQGSAPPPDRFSWPLYGYTLDHLRYFPTSIAPPFHLRWSFFAGGLLEFPPVISRGVLYQLNDNAVVSAVEKETGKPLWHRRIGVLSASTPAAGGGNLYATVLKRSGGGGRIASLTEATGQLRWRRDLPAGSESSPLLYGGSVYFGSQDGTVYALNASDGSVRWTYRASGAVKGSPTLKNGLLFFGDYGGAVHALDAASGAPVWKTTTSGAALGAGTFYATAAVAFGRVFIGNTDGHMYSLAQRTGAIAWARQTGNYIYASAAARNTPGLGPTIYAGSYDGHFYAFNARTGDVRWQYNARGKISGSATIVGNVVYFANLADKTTTGLDVRTGQVVYHFNHGGFDPVISDGKRIYLTGYNSIYALDPATPAPAPKKP